MATIPTVVPEEPVESAWGNLVASELNGNVLKRTGSQQITGGNLTVGAPSGPTGTPGTSLGGSGGIASVVAPPTDATGPNLILDRHGSPTANAGGIYASFRRGNTQIGTITIASATNVAFNTSSDPRIKHRTGDADDAADLVGHIGRRAFRGRWIDPATGEPEEDGAEWLMFSSHDVEDVAPFAVTGQRDDVDDNGNVMPQQVNTMALTPMLFAALAQALDRIDELTARVEQLETAR